MQINRLNILKFFFFLGIGALLIWLAIRNLTESDKISIANAFKQANYFWIFVSLALGMLSHVSRAMRWKILLQPLGFNPKLSNTFFAVMVGYLANYALPRLGEISRCGILTKYEKIPFTEGFGTVILERLVDLICLIIIFIITLIVQFDQLFSYTSNTILVPAKSKFSFLLQHPLLIVLIAIIAVAGFIFLRNKSKNKPSFFSKITNLLRGFAEGIKSIKNIKKPYLFLLHTAFIWFLYTASLYVGFKCFSETATLGIDASFAVLIFSTIGVIFVPGGTGATQVLVTDTLTAIFKISHPFAFAFAWIMWGSQFFLFVVAGALSLMLLALLNKSTNQAVNNPT